MSYLINIDNGGTLTDICVASGDDVFFTKTLTTPADLSECFFTGITKAAETMLGEADLPKLLRETDLIRYSSTQGTNALVERKGPEIGLITDEENLAVQLQSDQATREMFQELVGEHVVVVDRDVEDIDGALVSALNTLTTSGAERIIIAISDPEREKHFKHVFLTRFPRHLLGSVPVLFSWEFTTDSLRTRRLWSAILNSFLHPTLERFLYSAEHRLRSHRVKRPLLIYRNDGASSRVAKSVALKTYSSGPRGGLEGTRALAEVYGLQHVLMIDVGGTSTDIGAVDNLTIASDRRGRINGVPISMELSDVRSIGVGGSSVIRATPEGIMVGPDSVGAAPGPACFGFGGTEATLTDVNLLLGVLDPETYLNGELWLDRERSRRVITDSVAAPLGVGLEEALLLMEQEYAQRIAAALYPQVRADGTTTLAAFGGGGPMSACLAARAAGVRQVVIPRLAAVFSAYGISFSDIAQTYEADITFAEPGEIEAVRRKLLLKAERYMFQEGFSLDECELNWASIVENADGSEHGRVASSRPKTLLPDQRLIVQLQARHVLPHPAIAGGTGEARVAARPSGTRAVLGADGVQQVPVYNLEDQQGSAGGEGPAVVEGPFFTARVPSGWRFAVSESGDLILNDQE